MRIVDRPAEHQLAIECCRRNFRGAIRCPLPQGVDWPKFLGLAEFHRIEGLVNQAIVPEDGIPSFVMEQISARAGAIAARNLEAAAVSRLLLDTFRSAQVPLLFVKGLTLGALAYGNPALKSAIDIDLLIDPADLHKAASCLRDAGFDLVAPRHSLERWHHSWKESVWRERRFGVQLDLHTRLADNRRLIPTIDVHSPKQWVNIGSGIALPTLADLELLAYLAVHGATASWFRLKWIADFAALLSTRPIEEIASDYERCRAIGAGRAIAQALLLANLLFGSLHEDPDLVRELKADPAVLRLLRIATRMIDHAPCEPTERFLGTIPIHFSQFTLTSGAAHKLSEVRRQASQFLARVTI